MKDLATQIHKILIQENMPNIAPEDMDICRILSIHKFNIIDLVDMEVPVFIFSILEWIAKPVFLGSLCLLTLMGFYTSSSRQESSLDNLPRNNRQFSEERSSTT